MPTDNNTKTRVYKNEDEFNKAKESYDDSLLIYKDGERIVRDLLKLNSLKPNPFFRRAKNESASLSSWVQDQFVPIEIDEIGYKTESGEDVRRALRYKKPTTLPIYQPDVTNSVPPIAKPKPKPNLVKAKPKLVLETIKPLGIKPMETSVEAKLAGNVAVPAMSNTKGVTQNYTAAEALKLQGKPSGYTNEGDGTGRKEIKRNGGWLDGLDNNKFQEGGEFGDYKQAGPVEDSQSEYVGRAGMTGMMKSKIATEANYGNPSALRMVSPNPNKYTFTGEEKDWKGNQASPAGSYGTHFMSSFGNQARPGLQEVNGKMQYFQDPPRNSKENFNFSRPEDANYFAENYKEVAPMMRGTAPDVTGTTNKVIEDNRGQWAHPGKVTKINSNQITMKGVNYPVLGVSDSGDTQMMKPGGEYNFKGKTVTEYPQKVQPSGLLNNLGNNNPIQDNTRVKTTVIPNQALISKSNLNKNKGTLKSIDRMPEQPLTREEVRKGIKFTTDVAGLFYPPAAIAGSAMDMYSGDKTGALIGLIPGAKDFLTNKNMVTKLATKAFNLGIPNKVVQPSKKVIREAGKYIKGSAEVVEAKDDIGTPIVETVKSNLRNGGWLNNLSTNKFDMGGVLDGLDGIDKGTQVSDATATAKPVVNLNFAVTPAQKQLAAKNKRQAEIDMQVDHPEFYTNPNFLDKKAVKPYSVEDYKKGIKEPGLQTSMDPIDLVGTGVYKGVAKALGAKEVAKGYIGLIEDAVKYAEKKNAFPTVLNTAENIGYELSTTPKKISPTYQTQAKAELEKANNWSESWYNDPATKERLLKLSEEFNLQRAAEINKQRAFTRNNPSNLKNYTQDELNIIFADIKPTDLSNNWDEILKNIQNKSYISTFQSKNAKLQKILKGQPRTHEGNYGLSGYMLDSDYKGVRQNLVNKYSPKIKSTGIHEGNHGLTDGNELLPISDQEDIVKIFGDNTKVPARNNKNQFNSYEEYLQDPTEVYARIMELREHFKMKPGEIIDDDTIFKIMADGEKAKTPVDASFFTLIKNPYKFKDLFNRLPVAIPTAIGVGALQQDKKQNGGWLDNLK